MCGEAPRLSRAKPNMDAWEEIPNKCPQKTKMTMPS